jgi:hypothetical protein
MIGILQWTTLAVCGIIAIARIPSALRGQNRSLFSVYVLITLAILLSIEAPYVAVDQALGGTNIANLILRFLIFAAIFFLGLRMARAFGANNALRLITGPIGMVMLGASSLVVVVVFLMMDTTGSSPGLVGVAAKDAHHAALVECYGAAGRLYPVYVTLALLPAMLRTAASGLPVLLRLSAGILALGIVAMTLGLLFPVIPPALGFLRFILNYGAILCFVLGLVLIWLGKATAKRTRKENSGMTAPSPSEQLQNSRRHEGT